MQILNRINDLWFPEGHLNENQRDFLIELVSNLKPKNCIETGFASGRSAVTILTAASPDKLVSIDINLDYIAGARQHCEKIKDQFDNFTIYEGSSTKILNEDFFSINFPEGIDFAFVDGDHSYSGAKQDISKIYKNMNFNAVMVVDDYYSSAPDGYPIPDVNDAVDSFANENGLKIEKWYNNGKGFAIIIKGTIS